MIVDCEGTCGNGSGVSFLFLQLSTYHSRMCSSLQLLTRLSYTHLNQETQNLNHFKREGVTEAR